VAGGEYAGKRRKLAEDFRNSLLAALRRGSWPNYEGASRTGGAACDRHDVAGHEIASGNGAGN
jgi:hypothetical protein